MNRDRLLASSLAKMGDCRIKFAGKGIEMGNINAIIEWIKWLSYEPKFEKERIEYLESKSILELTDEELEEITIYRRNKAFARLFKLYNSGKCSEEEYMKVYDYMRNESIYDLMLSKLTAEELQYAEQEISLYDDMPPMLEQCMNDPEKYQQLSMVNSYILHRLASLDYYKSMEGMRQGFKVQMERNHAIRQKSLYAAMSSSVGKTR